MARTTKISHSISVVIVESPAKSRTIEKYLGPGYKVCASMGHVRDLPPKSLGVDIEKDFKPTYKILRGKAKVVKQLKEQTDKADHVYLATDLDREGEAIAWHLVHALNLPESKIHRVVFNEITPSAIRKAFANVQSLDINKVNAQQARRILDRLVGYQISPLLWRKVAKGLSAGRVQSVAVRLIVEREREIRDFKVQEYWKITAWLAPAGGEGQEQKFSAELARYDGKKFRPAEGAAASSAVEALRDAGYSVAKIKRMERPDRPPAPFTTSTLQQAASIRRRFSTKKTMYLAQQLYEGIEAGGEGPVGLITYMRTDSVRVADTAVRECRELIEGAFGADYLPESPPRYASRAGAQQAHEAIRPTSARRRPEDVERYLTKDQAALYKLVWERFVASQMKPARWAVTHVEIAAGKGVFQARGRTLLYDGHTRITGVRLGKDEQQLPPLEEAQRLRLMKIEPTQHFTQPPPRYSEASLVKKLEGLGIGRPSTYVPIISTIQQRGYVRQEKRRFAATELGELITDKLVKHFPRILDVDFTRHMEQQLDRIESADVDYLTVLREFYGPFSQSLARAQEEMASEKGKKLANNDACPECGSPLVTRWSKAGKFIGCANYPDCKYKRGTDNSERVEAMETEHKCDLCGATMLLRTSRKEQQFLGCSKYPDCRFTLPVDAEGKPVRPEVTDETCEKCGKPMVIKSGRRGRFLACSGFPKCRSTRPLPRQGGAPVAKGEGGDAKGDAQGTKPKKSAPKLTDVMCESCGKPMAIRKGPHGPFLGCSAYPKCKTTQNLPDELK
ncbi:MAG: type I DNA topoisomerase [Planctomycetia bacterium]|nr:type I DNA topoisomerase [Planctomycetia bacterium]